MGFPFTTESSFLSLRLFEASLILSQSSSVSLQCQASFSLCHCFYHQLVSLSQAEISSCLTLGKYLKIKNIWRHMHTHLKISTESTALSGFFRNPLSYEPQFSLSGVLPFLHLSLNYSLLLEFPWFCHFWTYQLNKKHTKKQKGNQSRASKLSQIL